MSESRGLKIKLYEILFPKRVHKTDTSHGFEFCHRIDLSPHKSVQTYFFCYKYDVHVIKINQSIKLVTKRRTLHNDTYGTTIEIFEYLVHNITNVCEDKQPKRVARNAKV